MQYNWSKYNLLDRLDELERLKKSAKRKERIIINQNIDFLKDNIDELNREIEAFNRTCDADPDSITQLIFKY